MDQRVVEESPRVEFGGFLGRGIVQDETDRIGVEESLTEHLTVGVLTLYIRLSIVFPVDVSFSLQGIDFEWDHRKAERNVKNHGVPFEEAAEAFLDPFYQQGDASTFRELREFILGYSNRQRLLLVVYVERVQRFRIISARAATRQERKQYEEA